MKKVRIITRTQARIAGLLAIGIVFLLQAINSFGCYGHSLYEMLRTSIFLLPALLPAVLALASRNPLRAVGASALFAPWLPYAFYVDCIVPQQGGGASMVYVGIVMFGLPCAVVGALVSGPVCRWLRIRVDDAR